MLDAPTRQRHLQLWTVRQTADKLRARTLAETSGEGGAARKAKGATSTSGASFAHEMTIDPLGFAFGGVDPGMLPITAAACVPSASGRGLAQRKRS